MAITSDKLVRQSGTTSLDIGLQVNWRGFNHLL
jgi:hypothetical protein